MAEIRPPVQIVDKVFGIDDVQKLSDLFLAQADEHSLAKNFKVQFADDHITQVRDDTSLFTDRKIIDREMELIEMMIGNPDEKQYARLVLNHGNNKEASFLECSAKISTWAGGFEDQIMTQVKQADTQLIGKLNALLGLVIYILIWAGFTFAFGKFLHATGITEYVYNLLTAKAAIRIIPNTYAPHSYLIAMFPSQFLASYFVNKFANIFPSIDLRIGKRRERAHQRLISFA